MIKNWIAFVTIVSKEVRRFTRIWPQTLLPPAVTTSLYFLIFGRLIGERLGTLDGVRYIDFIVPGVILMSVINHSYSNVVSSFYSTKFQRHIEELLIAPIPSSVILWGYVCGGIARGLLVGVVVWLIALVFSAPSLAHPWLTVSVLLLTAALFSLAGFINAVFADSFDDISIIPNFLLTPLSYLGGVFYTLPMLPDIWQKVSLGNPILYMVNAFRYGLIGISDVDIFLALGITAIVILLLAGFALFLLERGIGLKS